MSFLSYVRHRVVVMTELSTPEGIVESPVSAERADIEQHRRELTAYAYRMLGSTFEAEDAVQEAMLRAWRSFESFEGRAELRSWLYRITTNVCLDMLSGRDRRARPMDLGPAGTADPANLGEPLPEVTWIEPIPDQRVTPPSADPADVAEMRESIHLAFIAALQLLPPRQRAALILCEVLRWKAAEAAELRELWANPMPCAWPVTEDIKMPTHYPLAIDEARYQGDGVAVVAVEIVADRVVAGQAPGQRDLRIGQVIGPALGAVEPLDGVGTGDGEAGSEPGVTVDDTLVAGVKSALGACAAWHKTPQVVVRHATEPGLAERLSD